MAYGNQEMPGNPNNPKGIPANSVLIFNVQMLDAK
jgi:FKBP-type peptidyl-prolyl cis-trans isomerase